jgi:hypothetical protein
MRCPTLRGHFHKSGLRLLLDSRDEHYDAA